MPTMDKLLHLHNLLGNPVATSNMRRHMDYSMRVDSRLVAINSTVQDIHSFHIKISTSITYTTVANMHRKDQVLKPKVIQLLQHLPFKYHFDYSHPFVFIDWLLSQVIQAGSNLGALYKNGKLLKFLLLNVVQLKVTEFIISKADF